MKNGTCTKCGKDEVYLQDAPDFTIGLGMLNSAVAEIYICGSCGFLEMYVQDRDLPAIQRKLKKVARS